MIPDVNSKPYRPSPYNSTLLHLADRISVWLCYPGRVSLDNLLSCFCPITTERHSCRFYMKSIICVPILLTVFCWFWIPALLGLLIFALICEHREKFRLSQVKTLNQQPQKKLQYGFATANIAGHYECTSRYINNTKDRSARLREIGHRICQSQLPYMKQRPVNGKSTMKGVNYKKSMDMAIKTEFPEVDVFLIQEAIIEEQMLELSDILHTVYPYILFDVTDPGITKNYLGVGADLLVASKYPILEARFRRYDNRAGVDRWSSKGLLQVKVYLGEENGKKLVGYVQNTHMQVWAEGEPIHTNQLNDIVRWTKEFRDLTKSTDERVLFDVLGGDFNMDNTSQVDSATWVHPIWDVYDDPCRDGPGHDRQQVVGTEMRSITLNDPRGATPEKLKSALLDDRLRRWLIQDGDLSEITVETCWSYPLCDEQGEVIIKPGGGKRRVDFIMPRKEDNVIVKSCCPVTQLAGQTDHIAYSLTIEIQ